MYPSLLLNFSLVKMEEVVDRKTVHHYPSSVQHQSLSFEVCSYQDTLLYFPGTSCSRLLCVDLCCFALICVALH